jgi:sporulation protein YlmC with PRC-barrel domain
LGDGVRGLTVVDPKGAVLGRVLEIAVDATTGDIAWLTVGIGFLSRRSVRCPGTLVRIVSGRAVLAVDRETLQRYVA